MNPAWSVLANIDWDWVFHADRFVGAVSLVTGLVLLSAALLNWKQFFQSKRPAWFVASLGEMGARIFFALLGVFLIGLGFAIAFDWIPKWG